MNYRILEPDISSLIDETGLSSLSLKVIAASSLSEEQREELLDTGDSLSDSFAPCIEQACQAILEAKKKGEKIFIAGDYDADGICATAIMKDLLDHLGIANGYYIPNRIKEGYGLSAAKVKAAHARGYSVILTVDNGVRCHEAITCAHDLGMKVIVTDHHNAEEEIEADVVVLPELLEEKFAYLCGAGIALEISRRLIREDSRHTALAAIALLGDVMPLWKENRRIVRRGISALSRNALPPVTVLFRANERITEDSIRFQIVPRLNCVGRLSDRANVNTLVQYLLMKDPVKIDAYRLQLNRMNELRRTMSAQMVARAEELMGEDPIGIIYDPSFHEGICGLAAGKLARDYQRPFVVFARNGDMLKGSGRSIAGFDLYDFLRDAEGIEAYGGHAEALGISLKEADVELFRASVRALVKQHPLPETPLGMEAVKIEADDLSPDQIMELESMRPYPEELITRCILLDPEIVSVNTWPRITRAKVRNSRSGCDAVLFPQKGVSWIDQPRYLLGTPEINRWRDRISAQIMIEDIG